MRFAQLAQSTSILYDFFMRYHPFSYMNNHSYDVFIIAKGAPFGNENFSCSRVFFS